MKSDSDKLKQSIDLLKQLLDHCELYFSIGSVGGKEERLVKDIRDFLSEAEEL